MHRRATFILLDDGFDAEDITVIAHQLRHPGIAAAREERLTFTLQDLPSPLADALRHVHELHIRWISSQSYNASLPFTSSSTPGLHVFYRPGVESGADELTAEDNSLCDLLKAVFSPSLKCSVPSQSFTLLSDELSRLSEGQPWQYYHPLTSLSHLVPYIQRQICRTGDEICYHDAALLSAASYVDLDYDNLSQAFSLTAFWSKPLSAYYDALTEITAFDNWPIRISNTQKADRVEVGMLKVSPAKADKHEYFAEGVLTVVGEDKKPRGTLFQFPSRHHLLPPNQYAQKYQVVFRHPTGLHPTMQISFPRDSLSDPVSKPDDSHCALHAYLTLPSTVFADQYAFPTTKPDHLFTESHNIFSLRSIAGELDLEAPDYVVRKWGSTLLLELAVPGDNTTSSATPAKEWAVNIPLHLRYMAPNPTGYEQIQVPWPAVFWACTAEEGTRFPVNPFDRVHLGYEALFGPRTMFYHLQPEVSPSLERGLMAQLDVPVLDTSTGFGDTGVELGTTICILLGAAWVMSKLRPAFTRRRSNSSPSYRLRTEAKKTQ